MGYGADNPGEPAVSSGARVPVVAHDDPLSRPEGPARQTTSALYLGLMGLVALLAVDGVDSPSARAGVLVLAGAITVAALVLASLRLRGQRAPTWHSSQSDPFLQFATALAVWLSPAVLVLVLGDRAGGLIGSHGALAGVGAASLAAWGFAHMIRDLTPARALDAVFVSAIGALAAGLASWVALGRLHDVRALTTGAVVELLAPAVLDLFVVVLGVQALHLRARARRGSWAFVLAWTLVLVIDVSGLLAEATGAAPATQPTLVVALLVCGLLGAGALHPDSAQVAEPTVAPLVGLSRGQVALLVAAVLLGPAILALGLHQASAPGLVVPLAVGLSLLVVAYLLHLVQGRAALAHRAHHDELTGLANRTLFEDRAAVAIAHARRTGGHSAVLFLDLDRFKKVNDSLGHAAGNLLLQAVAKRLRAVTRAEDTVARLGGDEFVVLLPVIDDPGDAPDVAAKILERFGDPFVLNGHRLFITPSIGIALFPGDGDDADVLLENADTAMYRAKQQGRRTFCTYERSMNEMAHQRLSLENQLHTAIERGELRLHYQPKVHLTSGRVMGMEALLRWEHPELGLLEPASFIGLAEESGLIVPIGEWALEEACRQTKAWSAAGFDDLVVAVNLSLRQFQQQHIEDVTARILRTTGLDPRLLELELTESLAMQDPDVVRATLLDLRDMGVQCSIDDFGTGYSGLSHLTQLPVDKLKIDKSFVATIDTDREAPIVVAVVALAHGLGLDVVAEGVESADQLARLRELGCDEMQGYLFSAPLAPEPFEQLLMLESVAPGPGRLVPLPVTGGALPRLRVVGGAG